MNGRLVHGPYSQERRAELLRELLKTQRTVQRTGMDQGAGQVELIPLDELQEIRRIWVEEKGEIEDLLPGIYEQAIGTPYPGSELDPMPLDQTDLALLRQVVNGWTDENLPSELPVANPTDGERSAELYKLTRTLLAASFRGLQSRKRSKQLDELEGLLSAFAFIDEKDALAFAERHLSSDNGAAGVSDVTEVIDVADDPSSPGRKVIPILSDMSPLA
jgi:DNA sulfur modification protein DndC